MEAYTLTLNISAKSLSNLTTKDSFWILKMSWFWNWPWLFDLIKNWRRYWGLKRSLPIHGRMNVPCGKYLTFSDSGTLYCRVCSVDRGFRVRIPFVAGLVLWSGRVTFRNKVWVSHYFTHDLIWTQNSAWLAVGSSSKSEVMADSYFIIDIFKCLLMFR